MDSNDDGMVSRSELATLLKSIGVEEVNGNDLKAIMEELGEGEPEKQLDTQCVEDLILRGGAAEIENQHKTE